MRMDTRRSLAKRFGAAAAFSDTELEALRMMCAGLSIAQIAQEMGAPKARVRHYLRVAAQYSGAINRVGLVVWCVQQRIFAVKVAA